MDKAVIIGAVIGELISLALTKSIDEIEKSEIVLRIKNKVGITEIDLPTHFEGTYALALINFGIGKPKEFYEIFGNDYIKEAFQESFKSGNYDNLVEEIRNSPEWLPSSSLAKEKYDIDPVILIERFKYEFFLLVSKSSSTIDTVHTKQHNEMLFTLQQILSHLQFDSNLQITDIIEEKPTEHRKSQFAIIPHLPNYHVKRNNMLTPVMHFINVEKKDSFTISYTGIGGCGKTIAAVELLDSLKKKYKNSTILWGTFGQNVTEIQILSIITDWLFQIKKDISNSATLDDLLPIINEYSNIHKTIIILDDIWDLHLAQKFLTLQGEKAIIIITTRNNEIPLRMSCDLVLDANRLTDGEAYRLIRNRVHSKTIEKKDEVLLTNLLNEIQNHALAISIIAAQIEISNKSCQDLIQSLNIKNIDFDDSVSKDENINISLKYSINALDEEMRRRLCVLCALAPNEPFLTGDAISLFYSQFPNDSIIEENSDINFNEYVVEKLEFLCKHGLLEIQQEKYKKYKIHPLVRIYCIEKLLTDNEYKELIQTHAFVFFNALANSNASLGLLLNIYPQLSIVLQRAWESLSKSKDNPIFPKEAAQILIVGFTAGLQRLWDISGKINEAKTWLNRAINITKEKQDNIATRNLFRALGNINAKSGEFDKSLSYYKNALLISWKINNISEVANDLSSLSTIYLQQNNLNRAFRYSKKALQIAEINDQKDSIGFIKSNLARILQAMKEYDLALEYFYDSLSIAEGLNDLHAMSNRYGGLAGLHLEKAKNELVKAMFALKQGKQLARYIGDIDSEGNHLLRLGELFLALGQVQSSKLYLHAAREIFKKNKSRNLQNADYLIKLIDGEVDEQFEPFTYQEMLTSTMDVCNGDEIVKKQLLPWLNHVANQSGIDDKFCHLAKSLLKIIKGERDINNLKAGLGPSEIVNVITLLFGLENFVLGNIVNQITFHLPFLLQDNNKSIENISKINFGLNKIINISKEMNDITTKTIGEEIKILLDQIDQGNFDCDNITCRMSNDQVILFTQSLFELSKLISERTT